MMVRLLLAIGMSLALIVPVSQAADIQGQSGGAADSKKCDDEALKKAKAERDKWLKIYKEQLAAADDTRQREAEALAEAQKEFNKYAQGIAEKGVVTVGKTVFQVPDRVVAAYKEAKIMNSDKAATEKFLKLTKMYLEQLFKEAGYETAVQRAKWIDAALSGLAMDAMVLTKLNEAEFHAEQAYKQWLAAYESLMNARHAEDRVKKLEAACKTASGDKCVGLGCETQPVPGGCIGLGCDKATGQQDDDFKSSGERDADQAQKMMDGWKKVDGGFEDAEGNFHDTDSAFNEALEIVQGGQSSWSPAQPTFVAGPDYQQEWTKFRQPMIRAFQHLVKALEAYGRAEHAFKQLPAQP
ncbi:MAG: hypothetical protein HY208_05555 [Nitrospirae bacterium]|nr:hypothetical protein [Nitrospirota bacterium]